MIDETAFRKSEIEYWNLRIPNASPTQRLRAAIQTYLDHEFETFQHLTRVVIDGKAQEK